MVGGAAGVVGTVRCSRMQSDGADEVGPEADAVADAESDAAVGRPSDAVGRGRTQLTQLTQLTGS